MTRYPGPLYPLLRRMARILPLALLISAPAVLGFENGIDECLGLDGGSPECTEGPPPRVWPNDLGWVPSPIDDCPDVNEVCADWIDQFGAAVGQSCCIPPWAVGTLDSSVCPALAQLLLVR